MGLIWNPNPHTHPPTRLPYKTPIAKKRTAIEFDVENERNPPASLVYTQTHTQNVTTDCHYSFMASLWSPKTLFTLNSSSQPSAPSASVSQKDLVERRCCCRRLQVPKRRRNIRWLFRYGFEDFEEGPFGCRENVGKVNGYGIFLFLDSSLYGTWECGNGWNST